METKQKLAIVGIFWDGFYDLWEDFLELKEMFWKDCPYSLYIVNQTKELEYNKKYDVTVLHAGEDAEYSRKVQMAVKEIDADYLLLLLDDFFFSKDIEGAIFDDSLAFMKNNGINYYSMPLFEFVKTKVGREGQYSETPYYLNSKKEYTVNCQPAIWEKNFLKKCIGTGNYNAWIFEGIYAMSKTAHQKTFVSQCMKVNSNPLGLLHGALQGKLVPTTIAYYDKIGYRMKNRRETLDASIYKRHQLKSTIKSLIPISIQRLIKKLFNIDSVYGRYKNEIIEEMNRMGII